MEFDLNADQRLFFDALAQATQDAGFRPAAGWGRFDWAGALDARLEEAGFLDVGLEPEFGPVTAAELVFRLAQLPGTVEAAASALLRPLLGADLPRPLAVLDDDAEALRFLPMARTLVRLNGGVAVAPLDPGAAEPVDSLFAYPMGRLTRPPQWRALEIDPGAALARWRIALAAEIAGNLQGGLEAVLDHVRVRKQFGRPLGAFQGVQHRLAAAAVKIEGARWLALKAAATLDPAEAALALGQAQAVSTAIGYDLHQFMGAMGLTLEHPLHRWTYRARGLRASLGGAAANLALAARGRWEAA